MNNKMVLKLLKYSGSISQSFLILAAVMIAFWPCLSAGFINLDDPEHLINNHLLPLRDIRTVLASNNSIHSLYIPVTILSFGLERWIWGLNPFVFHFNNILLHALTAMLLCVLGKRMGLSGRAALTAALIFALHPMRVESVAWITERKDVLFGAFFVAAMILYWHYLRSSKGSAYIGALVCAIVSILAKPMAFSIPFVCLLLDSMAGRRRSIVMIIDKLPFILALWPVAMITVVAHVRTISPEPLYAVLVGAYSAVFYVAKFFLPVGLNTMPELPYPVGIGNPEYVWAILLLMVILAGAYFFRKHRWLMFALMFYILSIWPLLQVDSFRFILGERFTYVPSMGFALFLGAIWDQIFFRGSLLLSKRLMMGWVLAALIVGTLGGITFNRCLIWQDSLVFWNDIVRHHPDNTAALINRAVCYLSDRDVLQRYGFSPQQRGRAALRDLEEALRRNPQDSHIWQNLGVALSLLGRDEEASGAFSEAQRLRATTSTP